MAESMNETGGFLPPSLPSPAPSNFSSSPTASNLPHPRSHPLRAGSAKEEAARRFVEARLLHISRRYTKKYQPPEEGESVHGYERMSDVCNDLSDVIDILWLSGTPSLQIPYLLNIALSFTTYVSAFAPAAAATFGLLRKLDHAFASLMRGKDSITWETLPGFEAGTRRGMSKTDMVRCKSLVEATRVLIVEVMSKEPEVKRDDPEENGSDTDVSMDVESNWDADEVGHNMEVARVYEETIVQLGQLLSSDTVFDAVLGQS